MSLPLESKGKHGHYRVLITSVASLGIKRLNRPAFPLGPLPRDAIILAGKLSKVTYQDWWS